MSILSTVNNSADLKKLNIDQLKELCEEIREKIIDVTKKNGGHLASNLGIIETTVAIYYVFDLPTDKLIFDVGHQCYTHKILSGRKDNFDTIRTDGGLSGFPDCEESQYDNFTTGHAGNSTALSLGLCSARDKNGEDYKVINVVGDGSFVNGLCLEAISCSSNKPSGFLCILNDNEMSISKNVNALYRSISKTTVSAGYIKKKENFKKVFGDSFLTVLLKKFRSFIKRLFNRNNFFEKFGFKYVGIVDGNDLKEMIKVLTRIKDAVKHKAVFLHVKTTKGKGFNQAEMHADAYHGVGKNHDLQPCVYSEQAGKTLCEVIEGDKKVTVITAAMKDGTGMQLVENNFPANFHDVGIAEEYAITYAAGLAKGGLKPVVAIYSTFLQRGYDQILHDVCLQNLPVVFLIDRAGIVGADGKTHQGLFDLSFLTHLPNMKIFAPSTAKELDGIIKYALSLNCPCAIRYSNDRKVEEREVLTISDQCLWEKISVGKDGHILAVGNRMLKVALNVRSLAKEKGIDVGIINARTVKPLDQEVLKEISNLPIITMEENQRIGGFGAYLKSNQSCLNCKILSLGIEDKFVGHGSVAKHLTSNGLDENAVLDKLTEFMGK